MRVLTAAHYWPPHVGGVEFEAREQSRRLVARGHQLTVVSSRIADDRPLSFDTQPQEGISPLGAATVAVFDQQKDWNGGRVPA